MKAITTELLVLVFGAIIIAVVAASLMIGLLSEQARSAKRTAQVVSASVYDLGTGLGATVYVTNKGTESVVVTEVSLWWVAGNEICSGVEQLVNGVVIDPGQTLPISVVVEKGVEGSACETSSPSEVEVRVKLWYPTTNTWFYDSIVVPVVEVK